MATITADRVLELSGTVGAGAYTLNGAVAGYRTVASVAAGLGDLYYFAEDIAANGAPSGGWEVGLGTLNIDGTVSRTKVSASSNNNLAVVWTAGTRRFGLGLSAAQYALLSVPVVNAATRLIQTQRITAQIVLRGKL